MILPWIYPSQTCVRSLVANHLLSSPSGHCFGLLLSSFGYDIKRLSGRISLSGQWLPHNPCKKDFAITDTLLTPTNDLFCVFVTFYCHEIYFEHIFSVSFPNQPSSKTTTSSWRPLATNNLERSNSYSYNSDPKLVKHNSILKSSSWIVSWSFFVVDHFLVIIPRHHKLKELTETIYVEPADLSIGILTSRVCVFNPWYIH